MLARSIAFCAVILATFEAAAAEPRLTFSDRLDAQRRIEEVYYRHQVGASEPFERAVTRNVLERKVLNYLRQSVALHERWNRPITAEDLLEEWSRIERSTRLPMRLAEIYDALGRDPVVFQECFIRPVLVDRLVRLRFSKDPVIHRSARKEAERLWRALAAGARHLPVGPHSPCVVEVTGERAAYRVPWSTARGMPLGPEGIARWRSLLPDTLCAPSELVEEPEAFEICVLRGERLKDLMAEIHRVPKISWGGWWAVEAQNFDHTKLRVVAQPGLPMSAAGSDETLGTVGRCNTLSQDWTPTAKLGAPEARTRHTAVWTGNLMIAWGGVSISSPYMSDLDSGSRYDPITDAWAPTSMIGAPVPREGHSAVWTGREMIIWGGWEPEIAYSTGGRYDPISDTWTPTATTGAPGGRHDHTAIWTGSEMIVWGGAVLGTPIEYFNDGGRYDPESDAWMPLSTMNAPSARRLHTAVWTGSRMVVWGGGIGSALNTGGVYDLPTDSWSPTATPGAPAGRFVQTAIWTGSEMIVWGGCLSEFTNCLQSGGRYDPVTDRWSATSETSAPSARGHHTAVWTGNRLIVWGGIPLTVTGGIYDPRRDLWAFPTVVDDQERSDHTAVWTGSQMIVWGGHRIQSEATGGRLAVGPAEIEDLRWHSNGATLEWAPDPVTTTLYDVMSGDLDQVAFIGASTEERCLSDGLSTTQAIDPSPMPPAGHGRFFLVRGANGGGTGTYGCSSAGQERITQVCP